MDRRAKGSVRDMSRDRLFLLQSGFDDPKYPGERFFCPECVALEGVLAAFPDLAQKIEVTRVGFQRPRTAIAELLGEANQSAPVLVFGSEPPSGLETKAHGDLRFITNLQDIFSALAQRHGAPRLHP
jgi:hypothetical protein